MTKNLLIFAHECAPYNRPQSTIGAQRPAQFAKHLPHYGWRAIVLCCDHKRRETLARREAAQVQAETRELLRQSDAAQSLIIPTPSLRHDGPLDCAWRICQNLKPLRKALTLAKFRRGDWSQSWQPCARAAAEAVAREVKIDACLGEHGPDAGIFLARWFHAKHGAPWLADVRDPFLRPFRGLARRVYGRVARELVKTAAGTIAVTPVWAELDEKLLGKRVWCIPNGYDPEEFPPPQKKTRGERFVIAFAGNIRETFDIFIQGLWLLKSQLKRQEFEAVRFRYWGAAHEKVAKLAKEAGVSEVVETRPHTPRETVLQQLAQADLLLLLTLPEDTKQDKYLAQGLYPGKLFEYWGARRPILCVPSDEGLLHDLLQQSLTGVAFSRAHEIAFYLSEALHEWRAGHVLSHQPDEEVLESFTRRHLAGQLAAALDEISPA
jgi:glycosyltransferase involved in cell wall biosynthesis